MNLNIFMNKKGEGGEWWWVTTLIRVMIVLVIILMIIYAVRNGINSNILAIFKKW